MLMKGLDNYEREQKARFYIPTIEEEDVKIPRIEDEPIKNEDPSSVFVSPILGRQKINRHSHQE